MSSSEIEEMMLNEIERMKQEIEQSRMREEAMMNEVEERKRREDELLYTLQQKEAIIQNQQEEINILMANQKKFEREVNEVKKDNHIIQDNFEKQKIETVSIMKEQMALIQTEFKAEMQAEMSAFRRSYTPVIGRPLKDNLTSTYRKQGARPKEVLNKNVSIQSSVENKGTQTDGDTDSDRTSENDSEYEEQRRTNELLEKKKEKRKRKEDKKKKKEEKKKKKEEKKKRKEEKKKEKEEEKKKKEEEEQKKKEEEARKKKKKENRKRNISIDSLDTDSTSSSETDTESSTDSSDSARFQKTLLIREPTKVEPFDAYSGKKIEEFFSEYEKYCKQQFPDNKKVWCTNLKESMMGRMKTYYDTVTCVEDPKYEMVEKRNY